MSGVLHALIATSHHGVRAPVSPSAVFGDRLGAGTVTTDSPGTGLCTCAGDPAGGTFSWRRTSGDASITATAGTSAATRFTTNVNVGEVKNATFVCDYTLGGITVTSNAVAVTLSETT